MAELLTAKSLQSCLTLCDPTDGSPPGSPVPGILQARTLESIAISFSDAWKWKVKVELLSRVWLLATPWTAAYQAPLSMGFSRQEDWSGVPLPSPIKWQNLFPNTPILSSKLITSLFLSSTQLYLYKEASSLHVTISCWRSQSILAVFENFWSPGVARLTILFSIFTWIKDTK